MNVWIKYLFWSESYPTGPDDPRCENFKAASPERASVLDHSNPAGLNPKKTFRSKRNKRKHRISIVA